MIGKGKKTVSLAHKEKLLAEIAYYERRIEEALHKTKHNSFEDVDSSDDEGNPYTLNVGPSEYELKQQEASLSNRASMTLELAMLTIMQSEVNIMVNPPEVRRPVLEEGTWLEVAAECKIDLVSFTITFYAHKPLRKFAPTRFRSVLVTLTKPAHRRELAGSVLPKQHRPNLALQVLQSYATAFRSRRSTLLELAEKYADKLRMEAMPEGGYRVKFLDLLTVDWTLDNMWSPIVPFCHRMKFELEYMPKDYIHTIGRLYKQFKDPSLETAERTEVLAQIFDTCLEARGPARELQESAESDPETAGRLHERRTTIDQEPEIPPSHLQVSPKKQPKGKENKAQDRKTNMAPPKTIPKKAKKVASVTKKRPNDEVSSDIDVSKKSKTNDADVGKNNNDTSKSKPNVKDNTDDSRKGVKRATDSDANSNAKKVRRDNNDSNSKSKSGDNSSKNANIDSNSNASSMLNVHEKVKSKEPSDKNGENNTKKSKNKGIDKTDGEQKNDCEKDDNAWSGLTNENNVIHREVGQTRSKTVKDSNNLKKNKQVNTKDDTDPKNKVNEKISTKTGNKKKDSRAAVVPKDTDPKTSDILNTNAKDTNNAETVAATKAVRDSQSSKNLPKKGDAKHIDQKDAETKSKIAKDNLVISKNGKQVKEGQNSVYNKNKNKGQVTSKIINKNTIEDSIKEKDKEQVSSKTANKATKKAEYITKVSEVPHKAKDTGKKEVLSKDNTAEADRASVSKKPDQFKNNEVTTSKNKNKNIVEKKINEKVSSKTANKATKEAENIAKVSEVPHKTKDTGKKEVQSKTNIAEADKASDSKSRDQYKNNQVQVISKNKNKNIVEDKTNAKVSSKTTNKAIKKAENKDKVSEVPHKTKDTGEKEVQTKNNTAEADGDLVSQKTDQDKVPDNDNKKSKQKVDRLAEYTTESAKVQSKAPSKEKVKGALDGAVNKKNKIIKDQKAYGNKVLEQKSSNTKQVEDNLRKKDTNRISKTNSEEKSNLNDKYKKSTVGATNTKVNIQDNNKNKNNKDTAQKKNNLNETFEVAKSKMNSIKALSNQNNAKSVERLAADSKDSLQKKPINIMSKTVNQIQKHLDNQAKIAEKLKTKIPMMKNIKSIKTSLANKLGGRNVGITKAVEKTKIPMKSLPVFKKVVKNLPTRISPRKLPSTFRPSSQAFSNT